MPRFRISPDEAKRARLVKNGTYRTKIVGFEDRKASAQSKNPDAINTIIHLVGMEGPAQGVPVDYMMFESRPELSIDFYVALGYSRNEIEENGLDLTEDQMLALKGREVKAEWEQQTTDFKGQALRRPQNSIKAFYPVDLTVAAAGNAGGSSEVPGSFSAFK